MPPETPEGKWQIEQLLDCPTSDALLLDLDGDGVEELCTLSPFHGERVAVWHQTENGYVPVWTLPEDAPFSHAICGGMIAGAPTFVTGHRAGKKNLMAIRYDRDTESYTVTVLDEGRGPANVIHYVNHDDTDVLIAANRETDEVAMYEITE